MSRLRSSARFQNSRMSGPGKQRPVLLRLVLEDGGPLAVHFGRAERHGHFDFVRTPFVPRAAIQPHFAVGKPIVVLAALAGREHGVEAHAMRAVRIGQIAGRVDLVRPNLAAASSTTMPMSSSLSGFFFTRPVS